MRRLLMAAISAVSAYVVVVISYGAVLAGRDPFWYFAFFLALFTAISAGLHRLLDRRPGGTGWSAGRPHE